MPTKPGIAWWKTAVFYQIYPRSFRDTTGNGVGDLRGIIEKLDYLNDGGSNEHSLGIDALWISPFYPSPMKDFGYDVSDYTDVDPLFGTLEDARELVAECHRRGIRVIIDLVLNHTSDQHPWFQESAASADADKADWYLWWPAPAQPPTETNAPTPDESGDDGEVHANESPAGHDDDAGGSGQAKVSKVPSPKQTRWWRKRPPRPNNWIAAFEFKNAWWWHEERQAYYLGTFTRHQPEVNWRNPHLAQAMYDVVRFWLDLGVDGFRLDVVNWFIKDEQLRNNPLSWKAVPDIFQHHVYDRNRPETLDICKEMRKVVDAYAGDGKDAWRHEKVLVGEIFIDDPYQAARYHGTPGREDALHLAFNFDFLWRKWNARDFYASIRRWYDVLPAGAWPNFTLSNHDQPRHISRFKPLFGRPSKRRKTAEARARVAAALLLTIKGTPFLYYGEELGMENASIKGSEIQDPLGKRLRWASRDKGRTPMQWDDTPEAGFCDPGVSPWLPIRPRSNTLNVAAQLENPRSLLCWYRKLLRLRQSEPALQHGEIDFLVDGTDQVLGWRRFLAPPRFEALTGSRASFDATATLEETESAGGSGIIVLMNFSGRPVTTLDRSLRVEGRMVFQAGRDWTAALGTHREEGDPIHAWTLAPYEVLVARSPENISPQVA